MADLMTIPECAQHGQMHIQPAGTPEQAWCGVWYRCQHCTNTVLLPSADLEGQRPQEAQP